LVVTPTAFKDSMAQAAPPTGSSVALQALWWAGKGDWDQAHKLVMSVSGADAAWVHAYLHRVEGDLGNARYWYAQAGRRPAAGAFDEEWSAIVAALLSPGH
jgi:hypothetical protein